MQYGLIGEHLGHSYSCEIHENIADYKYELKELAPDELDAFLTEKDFIGINVTIPYKQAVIPYLDEISDRAKAIGAVNTIVNRNGRLFGDNTDFAGMDALLKFIGINASGKKALILGTGGTSKTAKAVLEKNGAAEIYKVSRSGSEGALTYDEAIKEHSDAQIIINTTPAGMYPKTEGCPIDIRKFEKLEGVLDAVYNPLRSNFVLNAKESGIPAEGGLYMLSAQAVYASAVFLDKELDESLIEKAYRNVRGAKQNVVMVGMPTSGKTTVGRIIAEKLGKEFCDTDALFAEKAGMTANEYIRANGEAAFRALESKVVAETAAAGGKVIATGGGVVLKAENVRALKRNGCIVFIDRSLENLQALSDRPLSSDKNALTEMFEYRHPIYINSADISVNGDLAPEAVAETIIKSLALWK